LSVGEYGPQALIFIITETKSGSPFYDHITEIVMLQADSKVKRKKFTQPAECLNFQDLATMEFQQEASIPNDIRQLGFTPFLEIHGIIIPLPKVSVDDLCNILLRKLPFPADVSLPQFKQDIWAMWKYFISHPRIGRQDDSSILAALRDDNYRKAALHLLYLSQNLGRRIRKANRSDDLR
jgi:hypothetical protein